MLCLHGQDIDATIRLDSQDFSKIVIEGRFTRRTGRNLSFVRSIAGAQNLADRVSGLQLSDEAGNPVACTKLAPGEYLSERDFAWWKYEVDISPTKATDAAAHTSWYSNHTGVLMLLDLLPISREGQKRAKISFRARDAIEVHNWPIFSSHPVDPSFLIFEFSNVDDAVFYLGLAWEQSRLYPNYARVIMSGRWDFESADVSASVKEILDSYRAKFGRSSIDQPMIAITKFPQATGFGQWQAETRGNNVTIVSSDMPFKSQSLQRLHEQLRHELFHLWIPNDVNLTGNYDWFYEGFALYESLKLAVALNRIRFEDFLDTLSRAHTIDSAGARRVSLIEASKSRFDGTNNTQVYARGMLVAFLTDISLLDSSRGKRSIENLLRELYTKHKKPADPVEANPAVIAMLRSNGAGTVVDKYIAGTDRIEWATQLAAAGIEDADPGPLTTLRVSGKLNGRQKTLLDKLGYNNWRKLSPSSK